MKDKLSKVKDQLRTGVHSELQAKHLAHEATAALSPDAMAAADALAEAFRAIPIADRLRGESEAARQSAINALDEVAARLEGKTGKT
jgi:hypothetical protein